MLSRFIIIISLKFSAPTWNDTFDVPDGSYNISEIQDYIEFIIKKTLNN